MEYVGTPRFKPGDRVYVLAGYIVENPEPYFKPAPQHTIEQIVNRSGRLLYKLDNGEYSSDLNTFKNEYEVYLAIVDYCNQAILTHFDNGYWQGVKYPLRNNIEFIKKRRKEAIETISDIEYRNYPEFQKRVAGETIHISSPDRVEVALKQQDNRYFCIKAIVSGSEHRAVYLSDSDPVMPDCHPMTSCQDKYAYSTEEEAKAAAIRFLRNLAVTELLDSEAKIKNMKLLAGNIEKDLKAL